MRIEMRIEMRSDVGFCGHLNVHRRATGSGSWHILQVDKVGEYKYKRSPIDVSPTLWFSVVWYNTILVSNNYITQHGVPYS
jgi:hypothetical protein